MLAREGARVVCCARTAHEGEHPWRAPSRAPSRRSARRAARRSRSPPNLARDEDCEHVVVDVARCLRTGRHPRQQRGGRVLRAGDGPAGLALAVSWRVTVHAPFLLMTLVLPDMLERGWGRIVNITSESAIGPGAGPYLGGEPVGDTAYGAQKAAIERLTAGARGGGLPGRGRRRRARSVADRPDAGRARERPDHRRRRPARGGPGVHARGRAAARDRTRSRTWRDASSTASSCCVEKGLLETGGGGLGVDPRRRVSGYARA